MRFSYYPHLPTSDATEAWLAEDVGWSFLVAHNKADDEPFFTSYRRTNSPIGTTIETSQVIMFHGDDEVRGVKLVPENFGYATLIEAQRACEVKFRQLRSAGNA